MNQRREQPAEFMKWYRRITLIVPLVALGLTGCGGGTTTLKPPPPPPGTRLSVNPSSITVDAGASTTFAGVFTPTAPTGGSLTWSISPVNGGTVTEAGVYTAAAAAGKFTILATWTPSISSTAAILKGSSKVTVLDVPQLDSVITPDQVQASGTTQAAGAIQNGAVAGQGIPAVVSTDSGGNVQVVSSFAVPSN